MVVVAQLVRAPDCGSGGRGFEPPQPPGSGEKSRPERGSRGKKLSPSAVLGKGGRPPVGGRRRENLGFPDRGASRLGERRLGGSSPLSHPARRSRARA